MSVYRPRFIHCSSAPATQDVVERRGRFANAHGDDVIRLPNGSISFVDQYVDIHGLTRPYFYVGLRVDTWRADHYDDPIEAFGDITPHCEYGAFEILVSSPFIQRRLPGTDKRWHRILLHVEKDKLDRLARIWFSEFRNHSTFFHFDQPEAVKYLRENYAQTMRTRASLLYTVGCDDKFYRLNAGMMLLRVDPDMPRVVTVNGRRLERKARPYYIYEFACLTSERPLFLASIMQSKHSEILSLSDIDCEFRGVDISTPIDAFGNSTAFYHFKQNWADGSSWRTARPHAEILNVCVALASLWLPPYVLLEILDWLPPCIAHHDALWKIRLIQGIRDSILRLRQPQPIARRTRSKIKL